MINYDVSFVFEPKKSVPLSNGLPCMYYKKYFIIKLLNMMTLINIYEKTKKWNMFI